VERTGLPSQSTVEKEPVVSPYDERLRRYTTEVEALTARSNLLANLRGATFGVAAIAAVWAFVGDAKAVPVGVAAVAFLAFATLVWMHASVLRRCDHAQRWVRVNEDARARYTDTWRELPNDGERFKNPLHPYAGDLDLFGRGSLFQRLSVAQTLFGQQRLAAFLMNRADAKEVRARQAAVKELASLLDVRQELEALALAVADPAGNATGSNRAKNWLDPEPLLAWAEGKPGFTTNRALVIIAYVAPPLTVGWMVACFLLDLHPVYWLPLMVAHALILITGRVHSARVFTAVSSTQGEFLRFGPMLELLESLPAESESLAELKRSVNDSAGERPSQAMRRFERIVSWFEVRHNGLVYPFINLVLLWDIHCVLRLERWQARCGKNLRRWFQTLGELEALSSLAAFAADCPGCTYPELAEGPTFEAEGLAHPLLPADRRVTNDVILAGPGKGLLVTGSNMSGKSTLLRAMGISTVLALAGAPVVAKRFKLMPMAVRTSMRISDSLSQGVSHFYAELRTLKSVLDATRGNVPVLFLLDEILHGTNSRERQIGARWVLGELLRQGAMGAVSTHDEGLCQLPEPLASQLEQVHFRETMIGDEMTFDYRLRSGPVRSGNALRLMQAMGIPVPLD
jgi:hypothetical protein